jgi:recombination protein RecT
MSEPNRNTALARIRAGIESKLPDIRASLPPGLMPERFLRQAIVAIQNEPKIALCTPASVILSVLEAAQTGIELDRTLQEGVLVPRYSKKRGRWECTFMPMYRGILKHALAHPDVLSVDAEVVCEKDAFRLVRGSSPSLVHEPDYATEDRGRVIGVYAVAYLREGPAKFAFISTQRIEDIRARAGAESGPWVTDWDEMAKKTAIKNLLKTLPRRTERDDVLRRVAELDDRIASGAERPAHEAEVVADVEEVVIEGEVIEPEVIEPEAPPVPEPVDAPEGEPELREVDRVFLFDLMRSKRITGVKKFLGFLSGALSRDINNVTEITDAELQQLRDMMKEAK